MCPVNNPSSGGLLTQGAQGVGLGAWDFGARPARPDAGFGGR